MGSTKIFKKSISTIVMKINVRTIKIVIKTRFVFLNNFSGV